MSQAANSTMGQARVVVRVLVLFHSSDECTCPAHLQGLEARCAEPGVGCPIGSLPLEAPSLAVAVSLATLTGCLGALSVMLYAMEAYLLCMRPRFHPSSAGMFPGHSNMQLALCAQPVVRASFPVGNPHSGKVRPLTVT